MTPDDRRPAAASADGATGRFEALDLVRALAILGMFGSHLVGTEGGATAFERGVTGLLAAIEPTVGALFCVVAGIAWRIQAERVGVTPRFRRYLAGRALALGAFGVLFHVLFWKTEILVPFALMMALSIAVIGARPGTTALALLLFIAVTPVVERLAASYAATDWLDNGLHAADATVGWVTLRYLLVDGNYPLISWMAFPLMGMLFWQTGRGRPRLLAWFLGSLGVAVAAYAMAAYTAPAGGADEVRRWIARGWTPTSALFLLAAGGGALAVIAALLWTWGAGTLPRVMRPLVLVGRASLSHYVLHIAVAYSVLRLRYPGEDWQPDTGLRALLVYLAIAVPLTVVWFRRHTHGPLESLWASTSRRPRSVDSGGDVPASSPVRIVRDRGKASLHAARPFARGEVVFPLDGRLVAEPKRFTIQVGPDAHLAPLSERVSPWACMNHGCDPNVTIDVPRRVIVARRPIATGDELRFEYGTTEWELAEPFACGCAAPGCVGSVRGFAHLSPARQQALLPDAAPHIRDLHAARRMAEGERQPVGR